MEDGWCPDENRLIFDPCAASSIAERGPHLAERTGSDAHRSGGEHYWGRGPRAGTVRMVPATIVQLRLPTLDRALRS
jgi:hypothetical protein